MKTKTEELIVKVYEIAVIQQEYISAFREIMEEFAKKNEQIKKEILKDYKPPTPQSILNTPDDIYDHYDKEGNPAT